MDVFNERIRPTVGQSRKKGGLNYSFAGS